LFWECSYKRYYNSLFIISTFSYRNVPKSLHRSILAVNHSLRSQLRRQSLPPIITSSSITHSDHNFAAVSLTSPPYNNIAPLTSPRYLSVSQILIFYTLLILITKFNQVDSFTNLYNFFSLGFWILEQNQKIVTISDQF